MGAPLGQCAPVRMRTRCVVFMIVTMLLSSMLLAPALAAAAGQSDLKQSVVVGSKVFTTTSGERTVRFVTVNLNDTALEVRPVLAQNELGKTESLASMAKRSGALAAINGTFFMAYNEGDYKPPWGKIVIDYVEVNEGLSGASIGFNGNALPVIDKTWNISASGYEHIISAGPTLVKNGKVVLDPLSERMSDPKLTTNSGQRSFIGYTADNRLVMGTVSNVTLEQLANICQAMGLVAAMNLDGGASSGLYAHGQYITTPGRELSNALVVVPRKVKPPIQVTLNGEKLVFTQPPIVVEGRVYVPFREMFEKLGATVSWDGENQVVTATMDDLEVKIERGHWVYVNGNWVPIEVDHRNITGHLMVPVRLIAKTAGLEVNWDEATRTVAFNTVFAPEETEPDQHLEATGD